MTFDTQGHEFDIEVQRFLIERWETEEGKRALERVVYGLKNSIEVRAILDEYVLDHPENSDSYGHPIYPAECIGAGNFWVLNNDDLRGIRFFNEDFQESLSFEKKRMDYARFFNCNFTNADISSCSLTRASFFNCNLQGAILGYSGGFYTRFRESDLTDACLWDTSFISSDFRGSNLTNVYWEGAKIVDPVFDHQTEFGTKINRNWKSRELPSAELPDIYRMIRIGSEKAELHSQTDYYLYSERNAFRRYILEPRVKHARSLKESLHLYSDLLWDWSTGYGLRPFRIFPIGVALIFAFAAFYYATNIPFSQSKSPPSFIESMYFSITSFATLGYGDLTYGAEHPVLRLISAIEALLGAAWIATFISVLSRKIIR